MDTSTRQLWQANDAAEFQAIVQEQKAAYEAFAKAYRHAFECMMRYKPTEIGSLVYAEQMAALADAHPEWAERVEQEG